ncbi:universal stress protein [Actinomadura nitritigenes]|uniref:Universal stress protein n=1 Tax=Actinomadura nitritigenes TaxID=134602 RepID=A0ABS3R546_9ACTN|nr:universal stress protein [Actinomadura nitritigenes]MBO2441372.1 universal stress protein [Actinomadura nitritigenes]
MSAPVIVGTDGSVSAGRAVAWAAAEAVRWHRRLHIVHVAEIWPYQVRRFAPPEEDERVSRAGRAVLAEAEAAVRDRYPDLRVTAALAVGSTIDALGTEAEGGLELVLGRRGRGGFADLLLGSVSLRMAGRSSVPVVIVRDGGVQDGEVAVGCGLDGEDHDVLAHAFAAASARGARLRMVHAWQAPAEAELGRWADEERINDERRARLVAACAPFRERFPLVDVATEVRAGHPVSVLAHRSRKAALLVVGTREHHWPGPWLGSVAHGVIHHAASPVAVVTRPK